jgi:hypothetical protein
MTTRQAIQANIVTASFLLDAGRRLMAREAALRAACEARRLGLAQELTNAARIYQNAVSLDEITQ